jgi:hypothetical protein
MMTEVSCTCWQQTSTIENSLENGYPDGVPPVGRDMSVNIKAMNWLRWASVTSNQAGVGEMEIEPSPI